METASVSFKQLGATSKQLARRLLTLGENRLALLTLEVVGLAAFRRTKSALAAARPSWLQTLLKSAAMVSTLWLAFRAKGHDQHDK